MGFQLWAVSGTRPDERIVLGGKLRIRAEARRRGLHLLSGLGVLLEQQRATDGVRITRLGIASVFGFASITRRLAHYDFVNATGRRRDLVPVALHDELARDNGYAFDADDGPGDVRIFMTGEQLARYPEAFFSAPSVRAYQARNPGFRDNGRYLAFAFEVDGVNVGVTCARRRRGRARSRFAAPAEAAAALSGSTGTARGAAKRR